MGTRLMIWEFLAYRAGKAAGRRDRKRPQGPQPITPTDIAWTRFFFVFWPTLVIIIIVVKSIHPGAF